LASDRFELLPPNVSTIQQIMQLRPLPFAEGPVFTRIFWIAFVIWTLPEVFAWKAKRSVDSSNARDQGSLILIAALWWIGIALDFSLSLFLPQAAISWQRTLLFIAGICSMLLGVALRWYSVSVLREILYVRCRDSQRPTTASPSAPRRLVLSNLPSLCHSKAG
jgi:hypothetical protein